MTVERRDLPRGNTDRLALRAPEVAELLGVPERTVYRWIADGSIPTIRVGRVALVPRRALEDWIERNTTQRAPRRAVR